MSFFEAQSSSYKYSPATFEKYENDKPILSIILTCYYNLDYIRQTIKSVLDQNYKNIELILIDNGAHSDVRDFLIDFQSKTVNCVLISFEINQFEWNDVAKEVAVCWNAAVLHAIGDYISHLSYDDLISSDYAARMVRLFVENPDCVTAAPMPYLINSKGEVVNFSRFQNMNTRGRYTDGADIAFDFIEGSPRKLFASPGEIFVIRRELLLEYGGYDRLVDISQVLKFAILGVSGFDPDAALYWRHHDEQLNKLAKNKGVIFYSANLTAWINSDIEGLWLQRFDINKINLLRNFKKKMFAASPITVVSENTRQGNVRGVVVALLNIVLECPMLLPRGLYSVAKELLSMMFASTYRRIMCRRL
jgi:glycosyltransferase involved in cell wall biosynthesis